MAKHTATTKQTSGAGFGFEDKVGAHFAMWMLLGGQPLFPRTGRVVKIEFQKRVDGYHLDDIVLTFEDGDQQWKCSLSVKSNSQFSQSAAPKEFVQAAWEMFLGEGTDRFKVDQDVLGLTVASLPDPPRAPLLGDLLPKAFRQEPTALARRLTSTDEDVKGYTSQVVRDLFQSFRCPDPLVEKYSATDEMTARLLKHLLVLELDFALHSSRDEAYSVLMLQLLVASGDAEDAALLWQAILGEVRRENEAGGYLDRDKLLGAVRGKFTLTALPDFAEDFRKLTHWGKESLQGIVDTIGGKVTLARKDHVNGVVAVLHGQRACVVVGPSGSGKSVVCKLAATRAGDGLPVIWFTSDEFTTTGCLDSLTSRLQLQHSLADVIRHSPSASGVVVLDGIERITADNEFVRVKQLLDAMNAGRPTSPWLLLMSCQSERWDFAQARLTHIGIDPGLLRVVQLPPLSSDDVAKVREAFPNLHQVLVRPHLSDVVTRPKVLDLLASYSRSMSSANSASWVGESNVIDWFWDSVVNASVDGPARATMLQQLAEQQADHGKHETPLTELGVSKAKLIRQLQHDGVCKQSSSDQIVFDHDLISDWCRQRVLLSREQELDEFLQSRHLNPQWHKAIRLYGLRLIEGENGVERWSQARADHPLIADLLLDSAVMAANSQVLLERLRTSLLASTGNTLKRLLRRFLHVATYPDPIALLIGERSNQQNMGWLRANLRRPLWPYWYGVLAFLHTHKDEVVGITSLEVAEIATIWLRYGGEHWPFRNEAAEVALTVGEKVWRNRLDHGYRQDKDDGKRYEAVLAAAKEMPDEVADICLRACARKLTDDIESGKAGDYVAPGTPVKLHSAISVKTERLQPDPWPDGPHYRVDEVFQRTCLFNTSMMSLMKARPAVASEVILACLIRHRNPHDGSRINHRMTHEDFGLDFLPQFNPAMPSKGPFWAFLQIAPDEAVDCILRLVDFATARWVEAVSSPNTTPPAIRMMVGGQWRNYVGDGQVCGWYHGTGAPDPVVVALMALENWFYTQLEADEDVSHLLLSIIEQTNSAALIAMLWEIGRFKPALFRGVLRCLLSCEKLYQWERHALAPSLFRIDLTNLIPLPDSIKKQIRDWEEMPHRKVSVHDIALRIFLGEEAHRQEFEVFRSDWDRERCVLSEDHPNRENLDLLCAQFDFMNWEPIVDDQSNKAFRFCAPAEIAAKVQEAEASLRSVAPVHMILESRRLLRNEDRLRGDAIGTFFAGVQELVAGNDLKQSEDHRLPTAVLAGIAVLAHRHWDWLSIKPERLRWCRKTLLKLLEFPPDYGHVWTEYDESGLSWEDFAAEAVVPFWASSPNEAHLRCAIAQRVTARHYSAVTLLMHRAYQQRKRLGRDFDRLVTLILQWAVKRDEINKTIRFGEEWPEDVVNGWQRVEGKQFVDGSISETWGEWGHDASASGMEYDAHVCSSIISRRKIEARGKAVRPAIDLQVIAAAFSNILRLKEAATREEREKWLAFWRQAVHCIASSQCLREPDGSLVVSVDSEAQRLYKHDHWFADRFAQLASELNDDEDPGWIWREIFNWGPPAHKWIEAFLSSWLVYGPQMGEAHHFVVRWKTMFDDARNSIWAERDKCWPHWDDFWLHLHGIDHNVAFIWQDEDNVIINMMAGCFEVWLRPNINDERIARAFLHWLIKPCAAPLRLKAMEWILTVARDADEYWWRDEELTRMIADILDKLWREQRAEIQVDEGWIIQFRELVGILVRRQNTLSMDLQDRMGTQRFRKSD